MGQARCSPCLALVWAPVTFSSIRRGSFPWAGLSVCVACAAVLSSLLGRSDCSLCLELDGFILENASCKNAVCLIVSFTVLCRESMFAGRARVYVSIGFLGKLVESTGFWACVSWSDSPLRHKEVEWLTQAHTVVASGFHPALSCCKPSCPPYQPGSVHAHSPGNLRKDGSVCLSRLRMDSCYPEKCHGLGRQQCTHPTQDQTLGL